MFKKSVAVAGMAYLVVLFLLSWGQVQAQNLPDFVALVKANGPAVVNISTKSTVSAKSLIPEQYRSPGTEELFDEMLKRFFGEQEDGRGPLDYDTNARGSGFILSEDGYVVTNHHVVENADEIVVKLNDRREFSAKLIGSDKRTDVALLKIEASSLPTLKIGDSSKIQVGEWALAIGSPFGFESSATSGIVSATGRSLPTDTYVPFIQSDVAINPGNSGGPLFNLSGEVIGINSQIYSRSGGFMGVSFAIPINMAMDVINQLKANGKVSRGWIGVYIQEVDQNLAQSFGLQTPMGALVSQVVDTGPAVNILRPGDVIVEFSGTAVPSAAALPSIVGATPAGTTVNVGIMRDRQRQTVPITIGELPNDESNAPIGSVMPEVPKAAPPEVLGMQINSLNDEARAAMGLDRSGVLIEKVTGEPAQQAGILAGDVIMLFDGKTVATPDELRAAVAAAGTNKTVAVLVHREGAARFLALKIAP